MRFVIVTGMSGAGKSTVLNALEDAGYLCVDNLPIALLPKLPQLVLPEKEGDERRIALGIDIRSREALRDLDAALLSVKESGIRYEILFLDAADEVLLRRYKETRRTHPLAGSGRIEDGIRLEREKIEFLREAADYTIDTSKLLVRDLKQEIDRIFVEDAAYKDLFITVLSFGFKYGIPTDADLVFDVRFLPNPYYIDSLRDQTGEDHDVTEFLAGFPQTGEFVTKLEDLVRFLIPQYIAEGKHQLVIALGCTGGRHRSVAISRALHDRLKKDREYGLRLEHRDLYKDAVRRAADHAI